MTQPPLAPGLQHSESIIVGPSHLVPQLDQSWPGLRDMPPVFATAMMIGFMEQTCIQALRGVLQPDQHSVGVHVDMTHIAATAPGMTVTAQVEVVAVDGRIVQFKVACHDNAGLIGQGTHKRAIIDVPRFMQKLQTKAKASLNNTR
jgi:fluoroacetyl-CoA thioesterase